MAKDISSVNSPNTQNHVKFVHDGTNAFYEMLERNPAVSHEEALDQSALVAERGYEIMDSERQEMINRLEMIDNFEVREGMSYEEGERLVHDVVNEVYQSANADESLTQEQAYSLAAETAERGLTAIEDLPHEDALAGEPVLEESQLIDENVDNVLLSAEVDDVVVSEDMDNDVQSSDLVADEETDDGLSI